MTVGLPKVIRFQVLIALFGDSIQSFIIAHYLLYYLLHNNLLFTFITIYNFLQPVYTLITISSNILGPFEKGKLNES